MAKLNWLQRETVVTPHMILCESEEQYLQIMKHLNCKYFNRWISPNQNATMHSLIRDDKITCIVCIDFKLCATKTLPEVCGLLVHEATHIWQELCESIGEHSPSKEFQAYSIQCIAQRLISDFMERGKWKKSKN